MTRISGKLTAKALGWDRNAIGTAVKKVPQDGGRVFLARIGGIVSGMHQTVNDDTGEVQTGLKGSFRGLSSVTEAKSADDATQVPIIVTAGRCYLPGGLQEMVEAAYAQATATDAKATVNFALDLYAIPATNKAGYSYDGDTVTEATESDPLDMLMAGAAANKPMPGLPALAAPEPEAEAPADPAPEPEAEAPAPKGKGK